MISISLFRFDGNTLIIDPEVLTHKVFRDVYNLDKDTKKELALKYFIYIYHCSDQRAVPIIRGYSKKEEHEFACREAGLQTTFKATFQIIDAINYCKENFISPVKELQLNLLNTLQKNIKILTKVDDVVEKKLEGEDITSEQLAGLMDIQNKVSKMAEQLTGQIKTLKELDKLLIEETDSKNIRRGGGSIKDSMKPNNDIEN